MRRSDFGKLIKNLRKDCFLPGSMNSMRQSDLGKVTGLGTDQIGHIERGTKVKLDFSDVSKIADGLQLTRTERKELHLAASVISDNEKVSGIDKTEVNNTLNDIKRVIKGIQVPAYIIDVYGNIVAANSIVVDLYKLTESINKPKVNDSSLRYHYLDIFFSKEFNVHEAMQKLTKQRIISNIQFFRRISLRYRYTQQFEVVFKELAKSNYFDKYWHLSCKIRDDYDDSYTFYDYKSPEHGELRYYAFDIESITKYGELFIILYLPADKQTSACFTEIAEQGNEILDLSKWPMT